jgi:hypothetical protein
MTICWELSCLRAFGVLLREYIGDLSGLTVVLFQHSLDSMKKLP